jgi:hypothetical protein
MSRKEKFRCLDVSFFLLVIRAKNAAVQSNNGLEHGQKFREKGIL